MIKNVIFDLGKVLINFNPLEYLESLGYSKDKSEEIYKATILDPIWEDMDAGKYLSKEEYIPALTNKHPELKEEIENFLNGPWMDNLIFPIKENQVLIDIVKNRNLKYYILSNYPYDSFMHTYEKNEFIRKADGMIISSIVKVSKPDPKIYELLLDKYNLKANECVFIDDRPCNIETAIKLGMKGIVHTDLDSTKDLLIETINSQASIV